VIIPLLLMEYNRNTFFDFKVELCCLAVNNKLILQKIANLQFLRKLKCIYKMFFASEIKEWHTLGMQIYLITIIVCMVIVTSCLLTYTYFGR